jgi:hypothetical protein
MLITKESKLSGTIVTKDIMVTQEQLDAWKGGLMIQDAMPNVSADDREFLMTGVTPEEWNDLFPDEGAHSR